MLSEIIEIPIRGLIWFPRICDAWCIRLNQELQLTLPTGF